MVSPPDFMASPAPSPGDVYSDLAWSDIFTELANYLTLGCYGFFSFLIALDVWRAITKRATWLPSKGFSLTGVTVQIIVWWTSVSYISNNCKKDVDVDDLAFFHQVVLSGKVAVCVFVGYLLPGMAAPSVPTFLALGISICAQIVSEVILFEKEQNYITFYNLHEDYMRWKTWAETANWILFICTVFLGLISVCAILGSQTFHGLLKQRTYAIFSLTNEEEFELSNERTMPICWNDFEDEVLSSWLVARACRADYVISRSVFSSAVGVVVTISVIICILSNRFHNIYFSASYRHFRIAVFSLLFNFIIIGWILIFWRWMAAQWYFRSHGRSWRRCLCLDDFWTRNTVELIHMYNLKKDRQRFSMMTKFLTKIFTKIRLHKLIYVLLMIQFIVVFLSKLCGLLSEVIIGTVMYSFRKRMRKGHPVATPENCEILKLICMPGEDPTDLWEANEMAFIKIKHLMKEGCDKGRTSQKINSFFSLYSVQWAEDGKRLLNMLEKEAFPSILKYFPSVEKRCVRITVVSLITIFRGLHKSKSARLGNVLSACEEVWDLLTLTDDCDIDLHANEISLYDDLNKEKDQVGMAAEREFYKLQMEHDKHSSSSEECFINVVDARNILQELLGNCEGLLKKESLLGGEEEAAILSDSKDWMKIAPKYNLYKLCKLMLEKDIEDFMTWTEVSLKNVIACSVTRLPDMLLKQCKKWAQKFEEDKFWEAIDLAGKCRGMIEAWTNEGTDNQI